MAGSVEVRLETLEQKMAEVGLELAEQRGELRGLSSAIERMSSHVQSESGTMSRELERIFRQLASITKTLVGSMEDGETIGVRDRVRALEIDREQRKANARLLWGVSLTALATSALGAIKYVWSRINSF